MILPGKRSSRAVASVLVLAATLATTAAAQQDLSKYPGASTARAGTEPADGIVVGRAAPQQAEPAADSAAVPQIRPLQIEARIGVDESNPLTLSLDEAVELALTGNRELEVERLNSLQAVYDLRAARGVFDPSIRSLNLFESRTSPVASVLGGGSDGTLNTDIVSNEVTLQKLFKTGGFLEVGAASLRTDTNSIFASINPQWQTGLTFTFRQPLMRGREIDEARRRLRIAQRRLDLTDAQFRQRVIDTIGAVQRAYWDLEFSLRNVQVARDAVELAETQLARIRRFVDQGVSAPVDLVQVEAELERRREGVLSALEGVTRAENQLKTLLLADRAQAEWSRPIIPSETAAVTQVDLSLDEAVAQALAFRPELAALRTQREINDIDVEYFSEQTKPQVDVFGTYGLTGLAGTPSATPNPFTGSNDLLRDRVNELSAELGLDPLPAPPPTAGVLPELVGGPGQSWQNTFSNDYRTLRAGVEVSVPLGNRTAEANLGRAQAEGRKIDATRQAVEQRVEREVRNALQAVQTARQRIETARAARQAAETQLASEQRRYEAGLSTTFLVLTRQNELSDARARELRALTDYNTNLVELQRVLGTTLSSSAIDMQTVRGNGPRE